MTDTTPPVEDAIIAVEPLTVMRGRIDTTTPNILNGVGFTVTKQATGDILISFTPPFQDIPSVVANAEGTAATPVDVLSPSASSVELVRGTPATDGIIAFIASGTPTPKEAAATTATPPPPPPTPPTTGD